MKFKLFAIFVLFFILSCSTPQENNRKIASLDNNGDVIDDSFDKNLENYYNGPFTAGPPRSNSRR